MKDEKEVVEDKQPDPEEELTYAEHVEAVGRKAVDLDKLTIGEKATLLVDDTLNKLLTGEIALENAQELLTMLHVVSSTPGSKVPNV